MYKGQPNYKVPVRLFRGSYEKVLGTNKKIYSETETVFKVSLKSYGGSEKLVNNQLVLEDTFVVETWYRKDITSMDAIQFNNSLYEIINNPENINMENRKLLFKVRKYVGGV